MSLTSMGKLVRVREMIVAKEADAYDSADVCVHGELLSVDGTPTYEDELRAMTTAGLRRERLRLMHLVLNEIQPVKQRTLAMHIDDTLRDLHVILEADWLGLAWAGTIRDAIYLIDEYKTQLEKDPS